jgi:hypothetical protein
MKLRLYVDAVVDEAAYAAEYALTGVEAADDAPSHVGAMLDEVVREKAAQMGYFTARVVATGVVG